MPSPLADAIPTAAIRRVLVTKLRHHGDVLLASPVLSTLARAATICWCTSPSTRAA
jgi:heptosyltransferase-3